MKSITHFARVCCLMLLMGANIFYSYPLASVAQADTLPGFTNQLLTAGLSLPTDFAFAPDGRIFITEQNGRVRVFKNNQLLSTPAITIPVGTGGDRGLLSVALDPSFSSNSYIYFLYTSTGLRQRISRFTVTGDTINPASEVVLLQNPQTWGGFLNAGSLRFGPDGKIYASFGSNGLGTYAQDISSLEGKFLRINKDGTIPADNPFANTAGAQPSIYAYGLRNPWKFNFGTDGKAIVGDVGESAFEKVVRINPGANYGWPTFEGDCRPNCGGVTPPLFVLPHAGHAGVAVVGGDVYKGGAFPSNYVNNYFYGDYVEGYIKNVVFDGAGNVASEQTFATQLGALAGIQYSTDGCLYYITIFPGELHKICYGANLPVSASASANVTSGQLPLAVQFGSASSTGSNLTYQWNFGDGTTGTGPSPSHTYTTKGVYTAVLTVSNGTSSSTSNVTIRAGYLPPVVEITAPFNNSKYSGGDVISFAASSTDPQDGKIPAQNYIWSIIPHHNVHIHTPAEYNSVDKGTFTIPRDGEPVSDTWHEFRVTVVNSVGLSTSKSVNVYPNLAALKFDSNIPGLQILVDGQPVTAPYETQSVVGINRTMGVVSSQVKDGVTYTFTGWSHGGAQNQPFVSPGAPTTYTANFAAAQGLVCGAVGTNTFSACYYDNIDLTGKTFVRNDSSINFDWGGGSPDASIEADTFSARWEGNWSFDSAEYEFTVIADDGVRVYVDGALVLDKWFDQAPTTYTFMRTMTPGSHNIKLEYYERYGGAVAKLTWVKKKDIPVELSFTDSVTSDKAVYNQGDVVNLSSIVKATSNVPNALIDTEIYDSTNTKVQQNFVPVSLIANQSSTLPWAVSGLPVGDYKVKLGVFASDWSKLYHWNDAALAFKVQAGKTSGPGPTLTFAVLASMSDTVFSAGATVPITTYVTATQDVANIHVHTEIYDEQNVQVGLNVFDTSLVANKQASSVWNAKLPSKEGFYTVKIGVFAPDYSSVYFWKNRGFQFTVGTPPGAPEPGKTYTINVTQPQDNSTVSGVMEIISSISSLQIDTYNIGWRTGPGAYFTLDTDPVTQNYKHAWIDFSKWTWMANSMYPLEFQATDINGNVIGNKAIQVKVAN